MMDTPSLRYIDTIAPDAAAPARPYLAQPAPPSPGQSPLIASGALLPPHHHGAGASASAYYLAPSHHLPEATMRGLQQPTPRSPYAKLPPSSPPPPAAASDGGNDRLPGVAAILGGNVWQQQQQQPHGYHHHGCVVPGPLAPPQPLQPRVDFAATLSPLHTPGAASHALPEASHPVPRSMHAGAGYGGGGMELHSSMLNSPMPGYGGETSADDAAAAGSIPPQQAAGAMSTIALPPKGSNRPKRRRATPEQLKLLSEVYARTSFPNTALRNAIASELDMHPRTVQIWFQNHRQKRAHVLLGKSPGTASAAGDEPGDAGAQRAQRAATTSPQADEAVLETSPFVPPAGLESTSPTLDAEAAASAAAANDDGWSVLREWRRSQAQRRDEPVAER